MKKIRWIRKQLIKRYGKKKTDAILDLAEHDYQECLQLCQDASNGEMMHLKNTILPTAACYKALLEVDAEHAFSNTKEIIINLCEQSGDVLEFLLKIPGMTSVFMKLLPKLALRMFGRECGFDYVNFKADRKVLQMDMVICPYVRYAKRLGVEELTEVFCESDVATYGNLSKIAFKRTETLGTGGKKCDFRFVRCVDERKR